MPPKGHTNQRMPCGNNKLRRCAEIFCIEDTAFLLYRCSKCQDWFGTHDDCAGHVKNSCARVQKTVKESVAQIEYSNAKARHAYQPENDEDIQFTDPSHSDTVGESLPIVKDEAHFEEAEPDLNYEEADSLQESYLDYEEVEHLDTKSNQYVLELGKGDENVQMEEHYSVVDPNDEHMQQPPSPDYRSFHTNYPTQTAQSNEPNVIFLSSQSNKSASNKLQDDGSITPKSGSSSKRASGDSEKPQRQKRITLDPPSSFTVLLLDALRTTTKPFLKCEICSKHFRTRSRLLTHMPSHYGPHLSCKQCPATFSTYNAIRAHSKTHPRKVYFCEVCGAQHTDRRNLETHVRTHTGEKPYKCDTCPRAFNDSYKRKIHQRRHNNDLPFKCELCPKRFVAAGIAAAHQKSHEGLKPFKCDSCDKSFVTKQGLTMHTRNHTGERPLACSVCDKRFLWAHSLRKHMRVHDEKQEFSCEECDKKFGSFAYMRLHLKRAHQIDSQWDVSGVINYGSKVVTD